MTPRIERFADQGCLVVKGPDRPGIVSAVAGAIARNGGNILQSDQFTSIDEEPIFYQRTVFHKENFLSLIHI